MPNASDEEDVSSFAPGHLVGGGRYSLLKQIGQGGMGTVWVAQDERLNERVALKFLSNAFRNDLNALTNLRKETQKSRKLTHPNIIRIHDLYEAPDELAFISMEFVDGMDLAQLQSQQPKCIFTWEFLQPIVKQLCDALDYAHGEDVIHRDLKPSNMMLDAKGRLKLADFGLAALMTEPYSTAHPKGYWAGGTIAYMSPQQLEGLPAGIPDDIYALGATLYELLTSRTPFYVGDVAHQARTVAATPITDRLEEFELQNEIPRDVRAMIMACLSKEPEKRPPSARAVAEWIGLTATSIPPVNPTTVVGAPVVTELPERSPPRRVAGVLIAVVIVAAVGAAAWFKSKPTATVVPATNEMAAVENTNVERESVSPPKKSTTSTNDATPTQSGSSAAPKTLTNPGALVDLSFNPGSGANVEVRALAIQPDGKLLVGGHFTEFNGQRHVGFVRLNRDGSVDPKSTVQPDGEIQSIAMQRDGKILLGGRFNTVNGQKQKGLVRLNPDLTVDRGFDCSSDKSDDIRAILATSAAIYIGGAPMSFHGTKFNHLARLDYSGRPMPSVTGVNGHIWSFAMQRNNQLLIGGEFTGIGGGRRLHLARINPDGQRDRSFAPNPNKRLFSLLVQPDDKIVIVGSFDKVADTTMHGVARLNPDGTVDNTFNIGAGANSSVQGLALQSDGKIVIGGTFHSFDGRPVDCLARLNRDGSLDTTFVPRGITTVVRSIAVQADGNIVVGGAFDKVDGADRRNIARIKARP